MSKNSTNSFISLLVGLMLGGILGILFAPDKGNNTRDRLSFRLDRYKRKLAICFRNKLNINSWLVRNGHAVSYKKYSKKYLSEEIEAKNDKIGIWQGEFEMPWDWRKNAKK